jgi:hypothetical protein
MAILGHSNLRSITKYVHMTQAHIDEGMRKFEAAAQITQQPVDDPGCCRAKWGRNGETREGSGSVRNRFMLLNCGGLPLFYVGGAGRDRTDE